MAEVEGEIEWHSRGGIGGQLGKTVAKQYLGCQGQQRLTNFLEESSSIKPVAGAKHRGA